MSSFPEGWVVTRLGDLLREPLRNGHSSKATGTGIGVRTLTLTAITAGDFSARNTKLTVADPAKVSDLWARSEDIFIERSNTPDLVGTARLYVGADDFAIFPDLVIRVRTVQEVMPAYVAHFLQTPGVRQYFKRSAQGISGSMPKISQGTIEELALPVMSFPEQRRITAALDSYLTRLAAAEQALLRAQANLKRYRASVLKAAVEGRLVPTEAELARQEGREYEPASVLLARILAERKLRWEKAELAKMKAKGIVPKDDRWKARYEEPAGPDLSGLPDLPEGWCWATVDAFLWGVEAGLNFRCVERPPSRTETGVVKVSAVSWGEFNEEASKTCTREEMIDPDLFIKPGDFLFSRANTIELVGACVIVGGLSKRLMLSDKILRLRLLGQVDRWLLYLLRSLHGRSEIESRSTGNQESMRNLSQSSLRQIRVPLPPLKEVQRTIESLGNQMSVINHSDSVVRSNLAHIARLRQSILKWAFEGKLVDQDPNDEPAAELLARIRAEREKAGAQKTKSRRVGRQPQPQAKLRVRSSRSKP